MSKRNDKLLLEDILESAQKISSYTEGLDFDDFCSDDKTIDAVIRNFEIIGEASNRISKEFQQLNSHIDWVQLIGLRNRLIHAYFGVDVQILWNIINNFLDQLIVDINTILK